MDKWDRCRLGVWQNLGDYDKDGEHKGLANFYKWMGEIGVNPQINPGCSTNDMTASDGPNSWLRHYFKKYGVTYQRVECLDTYNRNPALTETANPNVATRWNYYGESHNSANPLRNAQNASFLTELRRMADDPNQMAIRLFDRMLKPILVACL